LIFDASAATQAVFADFSSILKCVSLDESILLAKKHQGLAKTTNQHLSLRRKKTPRKDPWGFSVINAWQ
jgi:hypothetical protein